MISIEEEKGSSKEVTISDTGTVTIPKIFRDKLSMKLGQKVHVKIVDSSVVINSDKIMINNVAELTNEINKIRDTQLKHRCLIDENYTEFRDYVNEEKRRIREEEKIKLKDEVIEKERVNEIIKLGSK